MADYIVTDAQLTSIADAIRAKGGTSESLAFPADFVSAVSAFPDAVTLDSLIANDNGVYSASSGHAFSEVTVSVAGGGGHEVEDSIITKTISGEYVNSRVTEIGNHMFCYCTSLTVANFQNCTSIFENAFLSCSNLTTANFPVCTTIGAYAFSGCKNLNTISFPSCISIYGSAFSGCYLLTTISFPACTTISGSWNFRSCRNLLSVYFLGSSVPTLSYSNAFLSTPIAGYTTSTGGVLGSIYVRASLLTTWQSTTNWAYFSERFVGLTDAQIAALDG